MRKDTLRVENKLPLTDQVEKLQHKKAYFIMQENQVHDTRILEQKPEFS